MREKDGGEKKKKKKLGGGLNLDCKEASRRQQQVVKIEQHNTQGSPYPQVETKGRKKKERGKMGGKKGECCQRKGFSHCGNKIEKKTNQSKSRHLPKKSKKKGRGGVENRGLGLGSFTQGEKVCNGGGVGS